MDLRTYLMAIVKGWWIILLVTILGFGAGLGAYLLTPRTYANTIEFYVSTPITTTNNPQSSGQFAESRVNSYIVLMSSEQLASEVVKSTGIGLTPQQVSERIEATSEINTVILKATVTDRSPQTAQLIAEGIATTFPELVDRLDNQGRASDIVVINVVSGPLQQLEPVSPDRTLYVGGGLAAGLLLGLIIAILRELLDTSVRTAEMAQRVVGAPVIGVIDHDPDARRAPLVVGEQANSRRAEEYRQLRTNLSFIRAARAANVLIVTSSMPAEGKSMTAINLALTFVESGERVLLIDGDLRRPGIGGYLGLSNEVGLSNVLAGQVDVAEAIQPWGSDRFWVLASGTLPPNPSELLGSARMAELLPSFRQTYDKIIVDTPPVLPVTDAAVASGFADAVVLVVRHGKTSRTQVASAAAALQNVGAPIAGAVLNARRMSRADRRRDGRIAYESSSQSRPSGRPRSGNSSGPSSAASAHRPAPRLEPGVTKSSSATGAAARPHH